MNKSDVTSISYLYVWEIESEHFKVSGTKSDGFQLFNFWLVKFSTQHILIFHQSSTIFLQTFAYIHCCSSNQFTGDLNILNSKCIDTLDSFMNAIWFLLCLNKNDNCEVKYTIWIQCFEWATLGNEHLAEECINAFWTW